MASSQSTTAGTTRGQHELLIIGGGIAGLTAATFTARAGIETVVVNDGETVLRRNAHLENVPGFPAGVNPRRFADMLRAQATRNGAEYQTGTVTELTGEIDNGFTATITGGQAGEDIETDAADSEEAEPTRELTADRVLAASFPDADFLDGYDIDTRTADSKQYAEAGELGRTAVEGLYVAGRLAERYHQAVIAAGDGAEAAITLIHDSDIPFYNDWVAPEGYWTDRGREVPPGCEEIDPTEQRARQEAAMAAMQEYFAAPHDQQQRTFPSLVDDERNRLDWEQ
ncbi:NAD(P)/FAD-dependent oxidoreductase [Halonotius sp. GCM10025705]|uniref:NAD(P)/FAD-dependent oxidoreductase n=1 Tax=Halonotius sp. GCM10025705 TaxID=3252678 RepID=UPI0036190C86